jgi:hypothetical protein
MIPYISAPVTCSPAVPLIAVTTIGHGSLFTAWLPHTRSPQWHRSICIQEAIAGFGDDKLVTNIEPDQSLAADCRSPTCMYACTHTRNAYRRTRSDATTRYRTMDALRESNNGTD